MTYIPTKKYNLARSYIDLYKRIKRDKRRVWYQVPGGRWASVTGTPADLKRIVDIVNDLRADYRKEPDLPLTVQLST